MPLSSTSRASGLLLHITSLPSPYGIGDMGPAALAWIDRLAEASQGWWQSLPLGPTGYGHSPYQPLSSFAGNSLLISPDWLIKDELVAAWHVPAGAPTAIFGRWVAGPGMTSERLRDLTVASNRLGRTTA